MIGSGNGNGGNGGGGKETENFMYFFHPDHLGSSSYITDASGEVYQHLEYFAFGETFVEEHSNTDKMPYLYNGKELDEETGLYYYGARYYDAKTSVWLSVDPLAEKFPGWSPYNYTLNNPMNLVDPDGRAPMGCDGCPPALAKELQVIESTFNSIGNSITGSVSSGVRALENGAKAVGEFLTASYEGNSSSKSSSQGGNVLYSKDGGMGDNSKIGGKATGPSIDVSNLPAPVPGSGPKMVKSGATMVENVEALGEMLLFGNEVLQKADKLTDGAASGAIESVVETRRSKPVGGIDYIVPEIRVTFGNKKDAKVLGDTIWHSKPKK